MDFDQPRTAPVPDSFWRKHNSDAAETRRSKAPSGAPVCTVCGQTLNPDNAFTVVVLHGGSTFLHPDDVADEHMQDGGFMGCWDLGSSCVRLAPARVRAPMNRHPITKNTQTPGRTYEGVTDMDTPHNPTRTDILTALSALGYTGPTSYTKTRLLAILAQAKIDATTRAIDQHAAPKPVIIRVDPGNTTRGPAPKPAPLNRDGLNERNAGFDAAIAGADAGSGARLQDALDLAAGRRRAGA